MNRLLTFLSLILMICAFTACNENTNAEELEVELGYEYFPLEVGKYLVYEVDSVVYDIGAGIILKDSSKTYIKEEVTEEYLDDSGRVNHRIKRFKRNSLNEEWRVSDVWVAIRTERDAERLEENLRFVKMVFPVQEGIEWNGNAHIDETTIIPIAGESVEVFKNWAYEIMSVNEAETIGDFTFPRVATISQANSENLIEKRYSIEKYAAEVGLVYKEMRILDTQIINEEFTFEEKAEKGFILTQRLIEYN